MRSLRRRRAVCRGFADLADRRHCARHRRRHRWPFDGVELAADANPRQCQALREEDAACAAWWLEPVGSNFRTLPVCFRRDAAVALATPRPGHEGTAGIKAGHAVIEVEAGVECTLAR
ncbi:MAG: hypothetical protein NVV68_06530 [Dokdonella sp.]|nr:hypothetical protein [Dokdonella sp.]